MPLRYHKVKPVREATLETIKLLKETGPPIEESELSLLEGRPIKLLDKSPKRGAVVAPLTHRGSSIIVDDNKSTGSLKN